MNFQDDLRARLADLDQQHLRRKLRVVSSAQGARLAMDGEPLLSFASNDYLGLTTHPRLVQAITAAAKRYGAGAGASRLICGNLVQQQILDENIANLKGTEAALTFSSGYAAALGTIPALVGPGDAIVLDKLCHACLVDGARLSGATLRAHGHLDLRYLEKVLAQERKRNALGRILVCTESIFSMDGDMAPLRELVELKDRYGAWLLVDEAHATGLYGRDGSGLVSLMGLSGRVEVQMGTLSKALGSHGGYIAGTQELINWLVNRARSMIFSTGTPPAVAAASLAALQVLATEEGGALQTALWRNVRMLNEALPRPWQVEGTKASPIFPIPCGTEERALEASTFLRVEGIYCPAIRYPTVARGKARLRVTVSAVHTEDQMRQLITALKRLAEDWGVVADKHDTAPGSDTSPIPSARVIHPL